MASGEDRAPSKSDAFDVFLCHNSADKAAVQRVADLLRDVGLTPWIDHEQLRPGLPAMRSLQAQIGAINAALVFIGANGVGPWQEVEIFAFLGELVERKCPVIPVLLPDCPVAPPLPPFLKMNTWVDLREADPDPIARLYWGITGKKLDRATGDPRKDERHEELAARAAAEVLLKSLANQVAKPNLGTAEGPIARGQPNNQVPIEIIRQALASEGGRSPVEEHTRHQLDPHSALISNTMVCEVSRLVNTTGDVPGHRWMRGSTQDMRGIQLLDLFSLIEAVVLHEKLYTLPARSTDVVSNLQLRAALIDAGILCELSTAGAHTEIARMLLDGLGSVRDPVKVAGSSSVIGQRINFEKRIRDDLAEFLLVLEQAKTEARQQSRQKQARPPLLNDSIDYYLAGGSSANIPLDTFENFGQHLIGWIEYRSSGAYEQCTSVLRDAYYIFAAEHFGLPYWPHFSRIEFSRIFPNFFDKATRLQLYTRVANAFRANVEDVFDDADEHIAYIPPFATLVLDRCNSAADLIREILALRDEYASLRMGFARLEDERRSALTIKDRVRSRRRQKLLLDDVGRQFENPAILRLESVVRYVPDLNELNVRPASPSQYAGSCAAMPLELIAKWWRRRPVSKLFELKERLERVHSYEHLVHKVFGQDVSFERWICE